MDCDCGFMLFIMLVMDNIWATDSIILPASVKKKKKNVTLELG